MSEPIGSQAEYLDALAAAIRSVNGRLDSITRADLEARLGVGEPLHTGLGGVPRQTFGVSQASSTMGNTEPFIGPTNFLLNPDLTDVSAVGAVSGAVVTAANGGWVLRYFLDSGSDVPGKPFTSSVHARGSTSNPFNSSLVEMGVTTLASAATREFSVYFESAKRTMTFPPLPFVVAAARVWADGDVPAHWTTAEISLEIATGSGATYASSPMPLRDFAAGIGSLRQLVVATQQTPAAFAATSWGIRVRLRLVSDGSGTEGISVKFGELQNHVAYSPDPIPYSPQLATWIPAAISAGVNGINKLDSSGLRHTARIAAPSSQTLVAGSTLTSPSYELILIDAASAVTLTATPTIQDGSPGQLILLVNTGSFAITFRDQGTLAGSNLRLTASSITLGPRDSVRLLFLGSPTNDWIQVGNVVSVL